MNNRTEQPEQVGLPQLVYVTPQNLFHRWWVYLAQGIEEGVLEDKSRETAIRKSCESSTRDLVESKALSRMPNAYIVGSRV